MDTHERPVPPAFLVDARTLSVQDFFAHGNLGLFVPMMASEYAWGEKEVVQLLADIGNCVEAFCDDPSAILYLGHIVLFHEFDVTQCIKLIDRYAMPQHVYTIIDGQQRLSTIAIIACILYRKLDILRSEFWKDDCITLRNCIRYLQDAIFKLFTCDVQGSMPPCKPILVHGRSDMWTSKDDEQFYSSSVSEYLFRSLDAIWRDEPTIERNQTNNFSKITICIENWFDDIIRPEKSHSYPTSWYIRSGLHWIDPNLFILPSISIAAANPSDPSITSVGSFLKLFAFSHTFLQRCCFTVITPTTHKASISLIASYQRQAQY